MKYKKACSQCHGSGFSRIDESCDWCEGTGLEPESLPERVEGRNNFTRFMDHGELKKFERNLRRKGRTVYRDRE